MEKPRYYLKSQDIISNLPDYIVEKILMLVPIRDAVKTSVLSRKWRYKWTYIPELDFDEPYIASSHKESLPKLVNFIYRTLLLHRAPIQKFKLSTSCREDNCTTCIEARQAVDSWIDFLSRNNVKELEIYFTTSFTVEHYIVPSSFFSFEALSSLTLSHCILAPPFEFKGFRNLKTLEFHDIILSNDELFEDMNFTFPVLEYLSLQHVIYLNRLKITAPKLRYFNLYGLVDDICFVGVPNLTYASITLDDILHNQRFEHQEPFHLVNVLGGLTAIEELNLTSRSVQFLAMFDLPRCLQLPTSFKHLKILSLLVAFEKPFEISVTICLLKSAPNLQKLQIFVDEIDDYELATILVEDSWEAHDQLDCSMKHLKVVEIHDFLGSQNELQFIEFLLSNSALLDVLNIRSQLRPEINETMIFQKLLTFQRTFANTKIQYR